VLGVSGSGAVVLAQRVAVPGRCGRATVVVKVQEQRTLGVWRYATIRRTGLKWRADYGSPSLQRDVDSSVEARADRRQYCGTAVPRMHKLREVQLSGRSRCRCRRLSGMRSRDHCVLRASPACEEGRNALSCPECWAGRAAGVWLDDVLPLPILGANTLTSLGPARRILRCDQLVLTRSAQRAV
jgi:hypothetical protein